MQDFVVTALSVHMPNVLRWAGGIARMLRQHDISLESKGTGSAGTDALTLADLSLQELIVSALRDSDPIFRHCRIDAEESAGDLAAFPQEAPLTIGIDPIDGTRKYRDHAGNGYSVMLHLRSKQTVLYSLVFIPEKGPSGWWIEATDCQLVSGPDDPARLAVDVLRSLPSIDVKSTSNGKTIYINGFQHREPEVIRRLAGLGIAGLLPDQLPGCPYELIATGELSGALVHSPNLYDFPVTSHLARLFGGNAVFVETGKPIEFHEIWLDPRAKMLRLPGIVACHRDLDELHRLCDLARGWNPSRYHNDEL
jgi:3'(2'), 5'-bisphosphate nucleotidase